MLCTVEARIMGNNTTGDGKVELVIVLRTGVSPRDLLTFFAPEVGVYYAHTVVVPEKLPQRTGHLLPRWRIDAE